MYIQLHRKLQQKKYNPEYFFAAIRSEGNGGMRRKQNGSLSLAKLVGKGYRKAEIIFSFTPVFPATI
jgi:hypothetical protein